MPADRKRITIYMPKALLDNLRTYVPRGKRTAFIVKATGEAIKRIKLRKALDGSFGAWTDEDHPELATNEDIERYVRELRGSWRPADDGREDSDTHAL